MTIASYLRTNSQELASHRQASEDSKVDRNWATDDLDATDYGAGINSAADRSRGG
ncbi:hypothetical protein [Chamaesiphon sp. OTE_75_metabat_556]|uniref:hypothetical protein n=1 Tax=Chamaesiphon sp. OTE_75_metabat_556 TaxID=2964692 RepID=UPI00286A7C64|nr:hypothetical protein [Chamaesiphon sp. OTE_75_metabat_556]